MAESFLGRTVDIAVITLPSHFNDRQRGATRIAAAIAGLHALRIVDEATAAGMAHGIDVPIRDECNECYFVIYNLGAKESNLALESVDHGVFNVLESANDKNLGGDDFDDQLFNYAIAYFNRENNIDITKGFESMEMLKLEVKKAERALLAESSAKMEIPARHWVRRPSLTITGTQLQG